MSDKEAEVSRNVVIELEKALLMPEIRQSPDRLLEMLDEKFMEIGSSGHIHERRHIIEELKDKKVFSSHMEPIHFRCLGDEQILFCYRLTVNRMGKTQQSLRSSIWRRNKDRWVMLFHQGTKTG